MVSKTITTGKLFIVFLIIINNIGHVIKLNNVLLGKCFENI